MLLAFGSVLCLALMLAPMDASADPVQWSENGHWYEVMPTPGTNTWAESRAHAESLTWLCLSGHLVTITSQEEQDFLYGYFGNSLDGWMGGYQDPWDWPVPDENWHWVTGETWSYTNWAGSEPTDTGGAEFYLAVFQEYAPAWNDLDDCQAGWMIVEYGGPADVVFQPAGHALTADPGATPCADGAVANIGGELLSDIRFVVPDLEGLSGETIASAHIHLDPDSLSLFPCEDEPLEVCVTVPAGQFADAYSGDIELLVGGEQVFDHLAVDLTVNCVPEMDVVDSAYDVVESVMTLVPDQGATATGTFELANLGNCDLTGLSGEGIGGLPGGVWAGATLPPTCPWETSVLGEVEVGWSDPCASPAGIYQTVVTIRSDEGVSDSFILRIVIPELALIGFALDTIETSGTVEAPAETVVIVENTGNVDLDPGRLDFSVSDLAGDGGYVVPGADVVLDPPTSAVPSCESAQLGLSLGLPQGYPLTTYAGTITLFLDGEPVDEADILVDFEGCNWLLDVRDHAYDVAGGVMRLAPPLGGEVVGTFEIANLGNCDLRGIVASVGSGLPSGLTTTVAAPESCGVSESVSGTVTVAWPDSLVQEAAYDALVSLESASGASDSFRLRVRIGVEPGVLIYPNPCRVAEHGAGITVGFVGSGRVTKVRIYDMAGGLVADLTDRLEAKRGEGSRAVWTLTNDDGEDVASGVYLVVLRSGDARYVRKVMVIR
jgi:hypothetical protein